MQHRISAKKLNRTSSHRKAMFKNMASSLIMHEQISTTLPKAKAIKPIVEKLVTRARKKDLSTVRYLMSKLGSKIVVDKLLDVLGKRYLNRTGGYLRILKTGFRYGDMAPTAIVEFVERDEAAKGLDYFNPNGLVSNDNDTTDSKKTNDTKLKDNKAENPKNKSKSSSKVSSKSVDVKSQTDESK